MARILVAGVPETFGRLSVILKGHELVFVATLDDARTALAARRFDLVAVGVHFDESRMLDLLRLVSAEGIPALCYRAVPDVARGTLGLKGIEVICQSLGAAGLCDLVEPGNEATAEARMRQLVDDLVGPQHVN
jgi:hypothetical protein